MDSDFLYMLKKNFLDSVLVDVDQLEEETFVLTFDNGATLILEGVLEIVED